jgi:hypothetical protein
MTEPIVLDQELVRQYVSVCEEMGAIMRSNPTPEELMVIKVRVICAMVETIPNLTIEEKTDMILMHIRMEKQEQQQEQQQQQQEQQEEEVTDPSSPHHAT